jgi:hypothetical protein
MKKRGHRRNLIVLKSTPSTCTNAHRERVHSCTYINTYMAIAKPNDTDAAARAGSLRSFSCGFSHASAPASGHVYAAIRSEFADDCIPLGPPVEPWCTLPACRSDRYVGHRIRAVTEDFQCSVQDRIRRGCQWCRSDQCRSRIWSWCMPVVPAAGAPYQDRRRSWSQSQWCHMCEGWAHPALGNTPWMT